MTEFKKNKFDSIKQLISKWSYQQIKHTWPADINLPSEDDLYHSLVEPPQKDMGDWAMPVFIFSKLLKKAPPAISAEWVQNWPKTSEFEFKNVGPYINFKINSLALGQIVLNKILNEDFFKIPIYLTAPKSMIEFSQPNTHKELHVGHLRNLCLGDSLVKLMRFSGQSVVSSTFPGDVGTHVAKCLWYLKYHNKESIPLQAKGEWLGKMYSTAHNLIESQKGTPQDDLNKQQLTQILRQLEKKSGEFYDLWTQTRLWSIDLMKSVYSWANVEFDQWYWESEVDSSSVEWVNELQKEGKVVQSQGAVGIDLSEFNLGFCMLLKSDGTGLYATKDLELAKRKFNDHKIEKSIYVVDLRQSLHFQQVFKSLEILGFQQAKNCYHLQYNFVELPDGAMSSRKGNIVPLMSLIQQMENKIKMDYLERYRGLWPDKEIDLVATQVAQGAIRYGMLRQDPAKKIVFEMSEWLKLDGESGPFIQYSLARMQSLLGKLSVSTPDLESWIDLDSVTKSDPSVLNKIEWSKLILPAEKELMIYLSYFHQYVCLATENYKPSTLCTYLYDLAKRFNFFYHECPINSLDDGELKKARLALVASSGLILNRGLGLLGIPSPKKM